MYHVGEFTLSTHTYKYISWWSELSPDDLLIMFVCVIYIGWLREVFNPHEFVVMNILNVVKE